MEYHCSNSCRMSSCPVATTAFSPATAAVGRSPGGRRQVVGPHGSTLGPTRLAWPWLACRHLGIQVQFSRNRGPDPRWQPTRPRRTCRFAAGLREHASMTRSPRDPYDDEVVVARRRRLAVPGRSDPPGHPRPRPPDARRGLLPHREPVQRRPTPVPCREESSPRSGRRSADPRPRRSRLESGGHPAFFPGDSLQGKDAVGTREFAETQCHHTGVRCHAAILSLPTDTWPGVQAWLAAGCRHTAASGCAKRPRVREGLRGRFVCA